MAGAGAGAGAGVEGALYKTDKRLEDALLATSTQNNSVQAPIVILQRENDNSGAGAEGGSPTQCPVTDFLVQAPKADFLR